MGVQATGHGAVTSLAGHLMVSTRDLDERTAHPEGRARVGAGVKWLRVIEAAAPDGLAPLNGSSSEVGVVGYTTGGGVGPLPPLDNVPLPLANKLTLGVRFAWTGDLPEGERLLTRCARSRRYCSTTRQSSPTGWPSAVGHGGG